MPQDEHGGMTSKRILSIDVFRGFMMCMITIGSGEIGGGSLFRGLHKLFDSPVTEFLQGQMTRGSWGEKDGIEAKIRNYQDKMSDVKARS